MSGKNTVFFGFSNVHIAFMSETSKPGTPDYEPFIPVPGAVNFSPEPNNEETIFYADNRPYYVSNDVNGYGGDLEMAKFPDEILTKALGWIIDKNGALVEVLNAETRPFALAAQIEGDKRGRRVVFYSCTGSTPTSEYTTNEAGKEVKTETMALTISPYDLGVDLGKGNVIATKTQLEYSPEHAEAWNSFFTEVYIPEPVTGGSEG